MKKTPLGVMLAGLAALALAWPAAAQEPVQTLYGPTQLSQPQYKVRMVHNAKVRMRDGIELSTDLYLPDAPGQFPTVLGRTPYNNIGAGAFATGKYYAERGYAYVTQDVRGRYDSDGQFTLYASEANDGLDTLDWIVAQPWSNGKIGTTGGSYGGYVQIAPAVQQPVNLTAMAASVTTSDIYNNWTFVDGAAYLSFDIGWAGVDMAGRGFQYGAGLDWPSIYRHLPLATMGEAASQPNSGYRELLRHPRADDPFWRGISLEDEVHRISVPFLTVTGWYDIFLRGALSDHVDIRANSPAKLARDNKRLIVGPWTHNTGVRNANPGYPQTGPDRGVDFGPAAEVSLGNLYLRWQDHWLKGIDNGVEKDPPVKIFVMGENRWRDEQEWPLARTQYTKYFFASEGSANTADGNGTLSTRAPRAARRCQRHLRLRPGRPGADAGRQPARLPRLPVGAAGTGEPGEGRGAPGRAGVHHPGADRGGGGDRPAEGEALRLEFGQGHRLDGKAGGRAPGRLCAEHPGRHRPCPLPRRQDGACRTAHARRDLRVRHRPVGNQQRVPARAPHPRGDLQQQLPAL